MPLRQAGAPPVNSVSIAFLTEVIPMPVSVCSYHQNPLEKEGTVAVNQVEEDHLQGEATRAKFASSGSRAGATGEMIVNSNTRESPANLGERHQQDLHPLFLYTQRP